MKRSVAPCRMQFPGQGGMRYTASLGPFRSVKGIPPIPEERWQIMTRNSGLPDGKAVQSRRGSIEAVSVKGLGVCLLGAGDGTEVIHHHLPAGGAFALYPEPGWTALGFIYVLNGRLTVTTEEQKQTLGPGSFLSNHPVTQQILLQADVDSDFLYVTSQPVFDNYSRSLNEMQELAVSVEAKDGYTHDHCHRLMRLAAKVAEAFPLSPVERYHLTVGSFLHDLGKVKVPDQILGKPGPLTEAEWAIMRKHPTYGREMIEAVGNPSLTVVSQIVEQHHERWDGRGYPNGLKGQEILLPAAIISVVDAYDAMTTDRPYRKAMPKDEALAEIRRGRETQFHPDVVDAFLGLAHLD